MWLIAATIISYWIGFGITVFATMYLALQLARLCELVVDFGSRRTKNGMQSGVGFKSHMENE